MGGAVRPGASVLVLRIPCSANGDSGRRQVRTQRQPFTGGRGLAVRSAIHPDDFLLRKGRKQDDVRDGCHDDGQATDKAHGASFLVRARFASDVFLQSDWRSISQANGPAAACSDGGQHRQRAGVHHAEVVHGQSQAQR